MLKWVRRKVDFANEVNAVKDQFICLFRQQQYACYHEIETS